MYVNDTHKKRVMRRKRTERQTEAGVTLAPKGWIYFLAPEEELQPVWDGLTEMQQKIVTLMCERGMTPLEFINTVWDLFGNNQRRYDDLERAVMERAERSHG